MDMNSLFISFPLPIASRIRDVFLYPKFGLRLRLRFQGYTKNKAAEI